MSTTESINLAGKIRQIGRVTFVRAEIASDANAQFATVYYAVSGEEQPFGLRLDLNKNALLDTTGDSEVDESLSEVAALIVEGIKNKEVPTRVSASTEGAALDTAFDVQGVFWLPNESFVQAHGVLSYSPAEGLKLSLSTPLDSKSVGLMPPSSGRYDIIFGQLLGGGIVTLIDSFISRRKFGSGGIGSLTLVANQCLFGAHISSSTHRMFTGITSRFTSLEEWIGESAFEREWKQTPDGRSVTV